ncbi:Holliday junction resolvase RusA-like endonuclease [Moryella indoligenes]|uniref:Holliday junction resolvase RusA-like endonuclease n=1 Tax=Moryella indoligenes TaxID=371674 RepID=A0AAE3VC89_9FIRM|nr:hypothetical protein [Moryella indoligenes]MDQ0153659.1 Holliday junction resolvase RusA-like endonuclease [Moryella indoligenes]
MKYKIIIPGQMKGLNELLNGRYYDKRSRSYHNKVKSENDALCVDAIRFSRSLRKVKIQNPIIIDYRIFAGDKRHDRMNLLSAIDKSFEDALQKTGIIKNDGWDDVLNTTHSFYIDRENPRIEITIMEVDT